MNQLPARNSLLLLTIFVSLSLLIFIFYSLVKNMNLQTKMVQSTLTASNKNPSRTLPADKTPSADQYIQVDPNEHARMKIMETKELVGLITALIDPAGKDDLIKMITLQTDIIDERKIEDIDFSQPTNDLPTKRQEFHIIITQTTQMEGGTIQQLSPGELIHVTTQEKIYGNGILMAKKIKFIPSDTK